MKIIEFETKEELSAYAGELLFDLLKVKKDAILGLATGSSPLGFYDYVSSTYKEKGISFKDVKSFNPSYKRKSELELKEFNSEESLRLLYVAVTRAQKKLFITTSAKAKGWGNKEVEQSPSVIFSGVL